MIWGNNVFFANRLKKNDGGAGKHMFLHRIAARVFLFFCPLGPGPWARVLGPGPGSRAPVPGPGPGPWPWARVPGSGPGPWAQGNTAREIQHAVRKQGTRHGKCAAAEPARRVKPLCKDQYQNSIHTRSMSYMTLMLCLNSPLKFPSPNRPGKRHVAETWFSRGFARVQGPK